MSNSKRLSKPAPVSAIKPIDEAVIGVAALVEHAPTRKMASKQAQISFALPPLLLDKVDHMAESLSISRAAFIKQALTRAVNS